MFVISTVKGEESIKPVYTASKMIMQCHMGLALNSVNKQDGCLHNDAKAELKCY